MAVKSVKSATSTLPTPAAKPKPAAKTKPATPEPELTQVASGIWVPARFVSTRPAAQMPAAKVAPMVEPKLAPTRATASKAPRDPIREQASEDKRESNRLGSKQAKPAAQAPVATVASVVSSVAGWLSPGGSELTAVNQPDQNDKLVANAASWLGEQGAGIKQGIRQLRRELVDWGDKEGGPKQVAARVASFGVGVNSGVVFGAADAVTGLGKLAVGAGKLNSPAEWLAHPDRNISRLKTTGNVLHGLGVLAGGPWAWAMRPQTAINTAKGLWEGISRPYKEGDVAEGIGRGAFEVLSFLVGAGEANAATKVPRVATRGLNPHAPPAGKVGGLNTAPPNLTSALPPLFDGKRLVRPSQEATRGADATAHADDAAAAGKTAAPFDPVPESYLSTVTQSQNESRTIGTYAAERGLSGEEYKTLFTDTLRQQIGNRTVAVQLPEKALRDVLSDGRFKTLHETGTSGGLNTAAGREGVESALFGRTGTDGPVYGTILKNTWGPNFSPLTQYGDVTAILKPQVRQRSTVSIGDTLDLGANGHYAPRPLDRADQRAYPFDSDPETSMGEVAEIDPLRRFELTQARPADFAEVQIHKGVGVEDIDRVILPRAPDQALRAQLEQRGIAWSLLEDTIRPAQAGRIEFRYVNQGVPSRPFDTPDLAKQALLSANAEADGLQTWRVSPDGSRTLIAERPMDSSGEYTGRAKQTERG